MHHHLQLTDLHCIENDIVRRCLTDSRSRVLFPLTKLVIFFQVSLIATTKIKSPPRRFGKIPKSSEMRKEQ